MTTKLELLKKFLHGINVSDEIIELFTNEEAEIPDDYDYEETVKNHTEVQTKLFENAYKDKFKNDEEIDKKFGILKETFAAKVNKLFKLGFTRKELSEMDYEDVLKKAGDNVQEAVSNAQTSNDTELIEQVKTLQLQNAESKDELQAAQERYESEISKLEKGYEVKLNEIQVDQVFDREYEKYKFGLDEPLIPMVKAQIKKEIRERFIVNGQTGEISGIDGTHAQAFDDKGIYSHVSEPVKYLLERYNAVAKQQMVDSPEIKTPQGAFVKDNLSPDAKRMLEAAQKSE